MGRSRGVAASVEDDPSQRSKRRRIASSGDNLECGAPGANEGKRALYDRNYCNKDISGTIPVKCVKSSDFDLGVECFSVGAEITPYKSNHPYRVMVKKKTARQKVKDKMAKLASTATKQENASTSAQQCVIDANDGHEHLPQTVKRKISKTMRFYAKVEETHRALSATKTISKKKRHRDRNRSGKTLNDLSSLAKFLPTFNEEIAVCQPTAISKLNCKSRQKLVTKETQQLAAVLSHPEFQSNPFSAIQQHLENTLGPQIVTEAKPKHGSKRESSQGEKN